MPRSCINMEGDNNLEFRQKLLFINENLGHDDVEALKFLCSDLISFKNLESIDSAYQLFGKLMCEDLLNKENCFLVAELLFLIKQQCLLHQIGYTKEKVQKELSTKGIISPYRIMLYNLAEEITTENFDHIKFLLNKDIPKTLKTFLSLLRYLEKQELLSENNLELLETVCKSLSKSLIKRINQYKTEKEEKKLSVASGLDECLWKTSLQENKEEATRYEMTSKHRGLCIIFNNFTFKTMNSRKGSCKDAGELRSVFKWLGFTVTIHENKTKEEMENILHLCRNDPKHQESDCFVCCILTHGDSGCVYSSDEKSIAIKELLNYFTAKQCPGLINKPKLFFFQACQGRDAQEGVLLEADAKSINNSLSVPKNIPQMYIPTEADFLLGMATVDGCFAVRHVEKGSWYIQALCHHLKRLVPREDDILTILTMVNNDVSKQAVDERGKMKQMPQPAFTLRKKVIFPVPSDVSLL